MKNEQKGKKKEKMLHSAASRRVTQQLVSALGRQDEGGDGQAEGGQQRDGGTDRAQIPRRVEVVPRHEEEVVVVEEIGLARNLVSISLSPLPCPMASQLTTNAMPRNWTTATATSSPARIFHPPWRWTLPPAMMMRKPTRVASSATAAKLRRKPAVRQTAQKEKAAPPLSPSPLAQSESSGKGTHVSPAEVQRRCRPMLSCTVPPPEGLLAVYETHFGETMEATVMAVAVEGGGGAASSACCSGSAALR